ncbi:MAG: NAD regulator [Pseudomonadota bacterium]
MSEERELESAAARVVVGLNAVIAAVVEESPLVLCVRDHDGEISLPYGPFEPERHRTFDIGLRDLVSRQTHIDLGYVEQLYTFGDKGREAPAALLAGSAERDRVISVGYLALAPEAKDAGGANAQWRDWYEFFPWEDWRNGEPDVLSQLILPALEKWASADETAARRTRIRIAFGAEGWEEERALDRYELMYEAGLVAEARRDASLRGRQEKTSPVRSDRSADGIDTGSDTASQDQRLGKAMTSDHRRILATAIGRLRGKLKYRPVVFRLTPPRYPLLLVQRTIEAIIGHECHKQNLRRSIESGGFVERTSETTQEGGGRPAALFKTSDRVRRELSASGLTIPRLKVRPSFFS